MDRKFSKKRDSILIITLLAVAGLIWLALSFVPADMDARAEIYVNGTLVETVPLSGADRDISLSDCPQVRLRLENHAVAFISSDCPDKTCIRSGYLSKPGQATACLPNGVILKIIGTGDTDITVG